VATWNRRSVASVLLIELTACSASQTLRAPPPTPSRGQEITIWTRGVSERLHAVRVGTDSVSGIPIRQPLSCDSCRLLYRKADIDSVTVRRTDQAAMFLAMLPFAALVVGTALWRSGDRD
jgi:hypothetical protein